MVTEDRVKVLAYELWEQDGRPDGKDQEIYFKAQQVLQEIATSEAVEPAAKTTRRRSTRAKKSDAEGEATTAKPRARKTSTRAKKS